MAHSAHAALIQMERAAPHSMGDRPTAEAERDELSPRNEPVLKLGQPSHGVLPAQTGMHNFTKGVVAPKRVTFVMTCMLK